MADTTSRFGITEPSSARTDSADVPLYIRNLVAQVEALAAMFGQGPIANRPSPGKQGRIYASSDESPRKVYYDDGSTWFEVGAQTVGVPIGAQLPYGGDGDPADTHFLLADGRLVDKTTYANFFATVGHKYNGGVDPGGNQVRLPDKRGRTSVGADNMGTARGAANRMTVYNRAAGQNGGEERHTNSLAEMPSHGHGGGTGVDSPDHTHSGWTDGQGAHSHGYSAGCQLAVTAGTGDGYSGLKFGTAGSDVPFSAGTLSAGNHSHNVGTYGASARHAHSISSQGSDSPHNNMQPYEVDNWIVRVQ